MNQHGRGFWVGVLLGGVVMAYGVWVVLDTSAATQPSDLVMWIVGADLVHDALIAPAACVAGTLLARVLAEPWRTPVRAGLIVSAIVVLVGFPAWRGYGRDRIPDNTSALPLDYTAGIVTVLAVVWIAVAAWALVRATRRVRHVARAQGSGRLDT